MRIYQLAGFPRITFMRAKFHFKRTLAREQNYKRIIMQINFLKIWSLLKIQTATT